ncbi:MAG: hypothetical protein QM736_01430 [Vicinamibacterales bacterium]
MTGVVPERQLWIGLLVAPAAWTVEGFLGWYVGGHICQGLSTWTARATVDAISVGMLAAALGGLGIAWSNWRTATTASRGESDRIQFMSLGGVVVSASFVIGIVWFGLNGWLVTDCGAMR